ncbi:MAG: accessory factor UbiK family protein [Legionellaceae bacterium]
MFETKQLEALTKKLVDSLPAGLKNLEDETQQQFKDILSAAFDRLDLVTREEFDVQLKVLEKTREKVDLLEELVEQFNQVK